MQVACTIKVGLEENVFFKERITTVGDVCLKRESTAQSLNCNYLLVL